MPFAATLAVGKWCLCRLGNYFAEEALSGSRAGGLPASYKSSAVCLCSCDRQCFSDGQVNQQLSSDILSKIFGWRRGDTEMKAATANRQKVAKRLANRRRPLCGVPVCGACGAGRENLGGTWAEDSGLRTVKQRVWWGQVARSGDSTDYLMAAEMEPEARCRCRCRCRVGEGGA